MPKLVIHQEKIGDVAKLMELCPFGALELDGGRLVLNAGCRMCGLCVRKGPPGVFEQLDDEVVVDKSQWRGVAVYVEHSDGAAHPVVHELLGKASELAGKVGHPVFCLVAGKDAGGLARGLLEHGPDEVFCYEHPELEHFRVEPHAAVFEDFIRKVRPSVVLVGGTPSGRSLAPRVAARFRTGLTADCTMLDTGPDTDLDQIRPAYGGNIMAHINTPRTRPQFATVRYKIFSAPARTAAKGRVTMCHVDESKLASGVRILKSSPKSRETGIEDAEVIVVAGRGLKKAEDMELARELADLLGGQVAATRSLIEAGWADPRRQIGLSGRTVKPKLIITCGVSGAIQFVAGMSGAELIVAINTDEKAPIFKTAHIGIVGDLYQVVPMLAEKIRKHNLGASDFAAGLKNTGDGI